LTESGKGRKAVNVAPAVVAAIEASVNRYLALDPVTLQRLAALEGRVIAVELRGLDVQLFLLPGADGVQVLAHYEGEADARLKGTPMGLLRLGIGDDVPKVLFGGDVEVSGDTELGQLFKGILDQMEIDWEEHLSHLIGDIVAHQLARAVRAASHLGKDALKTLGLDASEYLQEESRLVVPRSELDNFANDVDGLRSDVDRLEARVRRLQEQLREP
jgi:ubiquinone biosynthesis protein UbiJ